MTVEIPNIINHLSIGTNDFERAVAFYDVVLATIGATRQHEVPGIAVAYGKYFPEFWVQRPINQSKASAGNGIHIAFLAPTRGAVDKFHSEALSMGATDDGGPGLRPEYGPGYYGAFVYDLDGHKIEANVIPGSE